jgi:hypothetical protein
MHKQSLETTQVCSSCQNSKRFTRPTSCTVDSNLKAKSAARTNDVLTNLAVFACLVPCARSCPPWTQMPKCHTMDTVPLIGPRGLSFKILLVRAPWRALYHFATMVGLGLFLCPRRFFYPFLNAESTVSTFKNTIEVKVYIHECIFWGCSVDHFREDNLAIFDHKIYP